VKSLSFRLHIRPLKVARHAHNPSRSRSSIWGRGCKIGIFGGRAASGEICRCGLFLALCQTCSCLPPINCHQLQVQQSENEIIRTDEFLYFGPGKNVVFWLRETDHLFVSVGYIEKETGTLGWALVGGDVDEPVGEVWVCSGGLWGWMCHFRLRWRMGLGEVEARIRGLLMRESSKDHSSCLRGSTWWLWVSFQSLSQLTEDVGVCGEFDRASQGPFRRRHPYLLLVFCAT